MHSTELSNATMLSGSIPRGILSFAFPILIGNLFQQFYNTADALIVGHFLDKQSLAGVTSSSFLIFMFVGFLNGIALGAGVLISKYFGARDEAGMHHAVHTDIAFGLAGGLALTVLGVLFARPLLTLMGTPADVLPHSVAYFRTYFCGSLAVFLYNIVTGILQAVGDSRHPLYYLILSSGINILLDLLFVGVFRFSVASAAAATVLSQFVSAALAFRRLMKIDAGYRVVPKEIRFDPQMFGRILRYGLPSGVQNSVIGFANVIVQSSINHFDTDATAGCGAYFKLEGFAFLPVTCFAMALSTFVSQNIGAAQQSRVKEGCRFGVLCSVLLTEGIGILFWIFAPFFIGLFNDDPSVIAYGVRQMRTESLFYLFLAFSHCLAGIMRGAGRAYVPMSVMVLCWCVIRVAYIRVTVSLTDNIFYVFTAYPLTWLLSSVLLLIYYCKVDWLGTKKTVAC